MRSLPSQRFGYFLISLSKWTDRIGSPLINIFAIFINCIDPMLHECPPSQSARNPCGQLAYSDTACNLYYSGRQPCHQF